MSGMTLNGALYLGESGLDVSREQITVAGSNLANVNTPGASREQVITTEAASAEVGDTQISSGVLTVGTQGTRNSYLDTQVQNENSNLGYAQTVDTFLSNTQSSLQESLSSSELNGSSSSTDTGLEAATNNFFNALTTLASSPTTSSDRDAVSNASTQLTNTANSVYDQILSVKADGFTEANSEVAQVNSLSSQISALNVQIAHAEAGSPLDSDGLPINEASGLRDQRQELVQQLSSLVNVNVTNETSASGGNPSMVDISLADDPSISLVSGEYPTSTSAGTGTHATYTLSVTGSDPATGNTGYSPTTALSITATNASATPASVVVTPTGGSIGGLVYVDNSVIGVQNTMPLGTSMAPVTPTTLLDQFNTYMYSLTSQVNTAMTNGYSVSGSAGTALFTQTTDAAGANQWGVAATYNLNSSSYDSSAFPASSSATEPDNGDNATAIANVINAPINPSAPGGTATVSDPTTLGYYISVVTGVGTQASNASSNLASQQLLSTQANNQQSSYSGISTDEEFTNLISYQNAFEASSRFINIIDQMYQVVTNDLITG